MPIQAMSHILKSIIFYLVCWSSQIQSLFRDTTENLTDTRNSSSFPSIYRRNDLQCLIFAQFIERTILIN